MKVHRWLKDAPKLTKASNPVHTFNTCCAHHGMDCSVHKVAQVAIQNAQREAASPQDWRDTNQLEAVKAAFELVRGEVLYLLYQKCGMSSTEAQHYAQRDYCNQSMALLDLAESTLSSVRRNGNSLIQLPFEQQRVTSGQYYVPANLLTTYTVVQPANQKYGCHLPGFAAFSSGFGGSANQRDGAGFPAAQNTAFWVAAPVSSGSATPHCSGTTRASHDTPGAWASHGGCRKSSSLAHKWKQSHGVQVA